MKLKDEDGNIVQEFSCKSVIGHAVVYSKRGIFIVDNATDGFTLYRLEGDGEPVRTFATGLPSVSVLKQVAFGEEGKTRDLNGHCTIASTSPMPGHGKTTIKIWAYDYAVPKCVQAAIIFDEYVDIEKDDKEGPTEGYVKNDIMMLRELAAKLMELA
ncbi:uncharacterized protein EDB91DRAFT_1086738 [Suillus paluster]|uniref:uncharacterized protein n=1 Tax=Suillus paluster TaxID=48578 RepID=UPI001B87FA0F|nr:uncharacterized protein EDB91DRAFT_1086738 [Suillus paluster]KAG1726502.1 hypothetical protein EDB91DRAFT_1086738 [Suillus paluster]